MMQETLTPVITPAGRWPGKCKSRDYPSPLPHYQPEFSESMYILTSTLPLVCPIVIKLSHLLKSGHRQWNTYNQDASIANNISPLKSGHLNIWGFHSISYITPERSTL